ncbi:T9SS type A sorting domain-containing protein [Winogradskyella ouciana]|uniref:T9SS type A sorting domain-containing protein n=1 Tax=Winogradskyella ouciana TaxID=2608631 RepID=A0A7K1GH01_9FLAO|nr:T9SS type A sorting domain-containing protein [Winogradskyella ouciana]MTE27774.1 T9SS type A sorting domain-containing protein [Winogradskyella ouciana]
MIKFTQLLLAFTLVFCFTSSTTAQSDECGFQYSQEAENYYNSIKEQVKVLEEQFMQEQLNSRSSTVMTSVPVKAHIIRTTAGFGGLTPTELDDAMAIMNTFYANAGLEFFLCEGINYINNDTYYDFETFEEDALTSGNNVNGVINIYFANSIVSSSSGGGLCGYAYYPGGPETILMANSCTTNGSTLSHEMGHFFGLRHTHGNSNVYNSTEELVDGSNCETTGDLICDTPADPKLGNNNVNAACEFFDFAQDGNGEYYQADPLNVMSYSRKVCRTLFSAQQYARINAIYQVSRNNLACPNFSADFIADETESCLDNFTVNFTDSSVGATSWSWDVDGDNIIDYTTQNVTHTYTNFGDYDVALTVSNGTNILNKVKPQYIEVGAPSISTSTITMNLTLDDWPAETSWQFLDSSDNVLYSGGPYEEGVDDFTTKSEVFSINTNECYSFIISDSYGDGICCFSGNGFYELLDENNVVLATGGDFSFGKADNFFNGTLSVDEFSTESISIFPNPSSSSIAIKTNTLPDAYSIYNTLGQVIKQSFIASERDLNINVESLTNGMYFIKLKKDNSSQTLSFIKN